MSTWYTGDDGGTFFSTDIGFAVALNLMPEPCAETRDGRAPLSVRQLLSCHQLDHHLLDRDCSSSCLCTRSRNFLLCLQWRQTQAGRRLGVSVGFRGASCSVALFLLDWVSSEPSQRHSNTHFFQSHKRVLNEGTLKKCKCG